MQYFPQVIQKFIEKLSKIIDFLKIQIFLRFFRNFHKNIKKWYRIFL